VLIGCFALAVAIDSSKPRRAASIVLIPILFGSVYCSMVFLYEARLEPNIWKSLSRDHETSYVQLRRNFANNGAWLSSDIFRIRDFVAHNTDLNDENCAGYLIAPTSMRPSRHASLIPCSIEGGGVWLLDNYLRNSADPRINYINFLAIENSLASNDRVERLLDQGWSLTKKFENFQIWLKAKQNVELEPQ